MPGYEMAARLDRYAHAGGIRPVQPYYIWGEFCIRHKGAVFYSDEAHEYCRACADALLARVLPLLPEEAQEDHRVSPASCSEEDTCKHCMTCGALLDYGLNDWGARHELLHYEEALPRHASLPPGEAFHIARIVEAAPYDKAILALARMAITKLPPERNIG